VPPIPGISVDCVEIGNYLRGNLKRRSLKILAEMLDGRRSGDDQDIGAIAGEAKQAQPALV
jgi:hypothetical protein